MSGEVSILVNARPIELEGFVQSLIDSTIGGMLAGLKGTGEIKRVSISIEAENMSIDLNDAIVPTNPFVTKIIRNTILSMASSLKGVGEINTVNITIKR